MANKTINVQVEVESRVFPLGTIEEDYHYELRLASDNSLVSEVRVNNTGVFFPEVLPGDYIVFCTKNNVKVSATVNIPKTEENILVPVSLVITVV